MSELTLKQLRALSALAEAGNFRRAADLQGVSQPSLSAQIDALEQRLGFVVAERHRGGTILTPAGREVLARARPILADVMALQDHASGLLLELKGTLRFGIKPSVGPYLMPHVVRDLHSSNPALRLYIRENLGDPLIEELRAGRHDLVLVETPVRGQDLKSVTLFDEPLMLVCAADHPLAGRSEIEPERLRGARVLGFSPQAQYHQRIGEFVRACNAHLVEEYEGTSLDALRLMTGTGLGVCFLPAMYVASEIAGRGDVVAVPLAGRPLVRSIGLAWRRRSEPTAVVKRFADAIRKVVKREFGELVECR